MVLTTLQNCQKIIILMEFASLFLIVTFLTIKIIKKRIDLNARPKKNQQPSQSAAQKYKQSEVTQHQFQISAVKATDLTDNDTCIERLMKKICQFNVYFNPLLMALPLNFIMGRSMAFSVAIYFFSIICAFLFNVFKVHRACIQHKLSRLLIQSIWIILSAIILINPWTVNPSSMLYLLIEG